MKNTTSINFTDKKFIIILTLSIFSFIRGIKALDYQSKNNI